MNTPQATPFDAVKIGIVSVSDRAAGGVYEDKGLPALRDWLTRALRNPLQFEARLIPFEDTWAFTPGFCFHPVEARKFIMSEIKRHKKDSDLNPEELMLQLIKMRYRSERYRHVRVDLIYSHDSKMG